MEGFISLRKMSRQVTIFDLSVQRGRLPGNYRRDYREIERIIPDSVIKSIRRAFCHHPINVMIKVIIFDGRCMQSLKTREISFE